MINKAIKDKEPLENLFSKIQNGQTISKKRQDKFHKFELKDDELVKEYKQSKIDEIVEFGDDIKSTFRDITPEEMALI